MADVISGAAAAPTKTADLGTTKIAAQVGEEQYTFETGKLAQQASAAVAARAGDTVVLATCVLGGERPGMSYFPLLVDYEERLYAAGKIKGSRWVKREGRASDEAILTGRVIDRTIRPLFPEGMRNDIQVVVTVLSIDGVHESDMLAVNAASAALHMSAIPFGGPIAAVRVGKIDGKFVLNPSREQLKQSQMDLIVSGTADHVIMVEAGANLVSEEDIAGGVEFAQPHLGILCHAQEELRQATGIAKADVKIYKVNAEIMAKVKELATDGKIDAALYVSGPGHKEKRDQNVDALTEEIIVAVKAAEMPKEVDVMPGMKTAAEVMDEKQIEAEVKDAMEQLLKKYIQNQILAQERRVDSRPLDETRPVSCEVGILPRTHGSALFTRGETQVLTTVTLGSKGDEQLLDGMEDPFEGTPKRYIHHYNMPGYSVGEVAPLRGPGRREIGHGALAERALEPMIPAQETFPYTMRLVSEAISSNGSTSMASTCGSTLALMDAGVPIKEMVGGVAMGLVLDEASGKFKVLTDIAGIEDHNGHMDFKVTGNENGITAMQMDVKVKGITLEILKQALVQAKPGRLHILSKMREALASPRPDLSPFAPRIISFHIDPEKIREVIGSGGKVINGIIAATGVKIDIEDDGLVMVAAVDAAAGERAAQWIRDIVREVQPGEVFEGKVTRLMDFGAFVEVLPGKEGLVHISELANYRVGRVEDIVKVGDTLKVQVKEIDDQGRVNLTHRPFAGPAPEGAEARGSGGFGDRGGFGGGRSNGGPRRNGFGHGNGHGRNGGPGGGHGGPRRTDF